MWFTRVSLKNPVFATMLVLSLTVIGTFAYFTLGVDLIPKVDVPTVVVTILNPGATAEEIETEITKRVEDSVNTISEIDAVRSTSVQGVSTVIVTFSLDKNGDIGAQEIRDNRPFNANQIVTDYLSNRVETIIEGTRPSLFSPVTRSREVSTVLVNFEGRTYAPQGARSYELPSKSGQESANVITFLLTRPQTADVKAAAQAAIAWPRNTTWTGFLRRWPSGLRAPGWL